MSVVPGQWLIFFVTLCRYGENVVEANEDSSWTCPICREICNCSRCRRAKGWEPTGDIYSKVKLKDLPLLNWIDVCLVDVVLLCYSSLLYVMKQDAVFATESKLLC